MVFRYNFKNVLLFLLSSGSKFLSFIRMILGLFLGMASLYVHMNEVDNSVSFAGLNSNATFVFLFSCHICQLTFSNISSDLYIKSCELVSSNVEKVG